MGLGTLIIMIMIGLPVAIFATHFAGGSSRPSLQTDEQTISIFHQDFPQEPIEHIIYSADRRIAFFPLEDNRTGVVYGFGNRFLTRELSPSDVISAQLTGPAGLKLVLRDFTWPASTFSFSDTTSRDTVMNWLAANLSHGEDSVDDRSSVL